MLGHSVGEIAAAYAAGIFTVAEAVACAHGLGCAMQNLPGAMLHVELQRKSLECLEENFVGHDRWRWWIVGYCEYGVWGEEYHGTGEKLRCMSGSLMWKVLACVH